MQCDKLIEDYLRSDQLKEWRGQTEDDVQEIVDTMNMLSTESEFRYKLGKGAKYINVKCTQQGCNFCLWFSNKNEEEKYKLIRKTTISHKPASHNK